ncbi:MFS transporter [Candidatus Binatia bacterium]|nr:MFS transporter [Candidatus Binatia bacterium]
MQTRPQTHEVVTPPGGFLGESLRAWLALGIGVLAVSAHSALSFGMSPLLKPITDELGWTRSQYAAAMNFRLLLLMIVAPFAGQLVDRFGARVVLAAGAVAMGVGTCALSGVNALSQLYAVNLLIGPGQACIGSVAGSALVLRLFRRRRGLAIGVLNGGDNLITSGVHVGAAALLVSVGWRGTLSTLGAAYLALGLLIYVVLRADEGAGHAAPDDGSTERAARGRARLRHLPWREPTLWLLIATYVLVYAFITSVGIHFPAFQRDLGRSADEASYIYGLSTLIGAFGSVAIGQLSERTSARAALVSIVIGLALTSVILWLPGVTTMGFYAWAVVYGVVNAGAVALLALVLNELFGAGQMGRLMGVAMVFCMAGTIAGNYLSAAIFDHYGSYVRVWEGYTVLMVVALLPALMLSRLALPGTRADRA